MRNLEEEIREILYKINYKKGSTISENIILEKKPLISEPKKITINEGWEKFPCVAKYPGARWVKLTDGSQGIQINRSGNIELYYSNGRYDDGDYIRSYSCNESFWQLITKHYAKLSQGDYSTKTWGGQPLQSIVGKTLPDGAYTGQGRHTGGEYFKNPLNDGYDYMYMPGLAFSDNQPRWVLMPMSLRNEKWPNLGGTIDQFIANNTNWYSNRNAVKFMYDAWMSEKAITKDPIVSEITPLQEDSWSPLARAMLTKLKLLGTHSEAIETQRNATKITIKKVKESLDKNKVLKFGMKDAEYFQNKSDELFDWKSVTPDTLYIKNLQNLLNNAALATNRQTIPVNGIFDKPTEILLKQLTEKTEITLSQLESIIKEKYGLNAAALKGPYEGYWQTVADLKSKGFKNTGCYKSDNKNNNGCVNKKQHLDQAAWLEMMYLADEVATKINIALGCQNISTRGGAQNQIPNYSKATAEDLVNNRKFLTNNSKMPKIMPKISEEDIEGLNNMTGNEFMLVSMIKENKKLNQQVSPEVLKEYNPNNKDIKKLEKWYDLYNTMTVSTSRPYHTYFVLDEMYFGGGVALTGKRDETSKNMWNDKTFFPDGPWEFFKTYYQTESPSEIRQAWSTYGMEMYVTSCVDVQKPPSITNADIHSVLGFAEVGLVALSFIPTPLSPLLFALSTAMGAADTMLYFAEGDVYMGMMLAGFTLLGAGEIGQLLKQSAAANKVAMAYGSKSTKEAMETLAKKYTTGQAKTWEKEAMNELKDVFMKNGGKKVVENKFTQIAKDNLGRAKEIFKARGVGYTFQNFFTLVTAYNKAGKTSVLKLPVTLGGVFATPIAIDQIYVGMYGNNEERKNNPMFKMFMTAKGWTETQFKKLIGDPSVKEDLDKWFKEFDKEFKDSTKLDRMFEAIEKFSTTIQLKADDIDKMAKVVGDDPVIFTTSANPNKKIDSALGIDDNNFNFKTPKIVDVEAGLSKIFEGMGGDPVIEIQKLLKYKWKFNLGDSGIKKDGVDGNFDTRMTEKITAFQKNIFFGLDELAKKAKVELTMEQTGEVDKTTMWYLKNATEENLKMPTLKLMDLSVANLTDESAEFFVNNKKYYLYRASKDEWVEKTKEEYEELKSKGLKTKEVDNWEKINKIEYMTYTREGRETKYEEKIELKQLPTDNSDEDLSRREKKKKEEQKKKQEEWANYYKQQFQNKQTLGKNDQITNQ